MTNAVLPENSVLLMQFRQFTVELIRRKQQMERQFPTQIADPLDPAAANNVESEIAQARSALVGILEGQATRIGEIGGSQSLGIYREAEYVMAVLADELMLNAQWTGSSRWRLLEDQLFGTHAAGEIFFQRLDRLLAPVALPSRELAIVYLWALALDFRGRYRDFDPQKALPRYRRQIFGRVYGHSPEQEARGRMFPLSYQHDSEDQARRLSSAHHWWWALAAVAVTWVLISSVLWMRMAAPIHMQTQRIRSLPGGSGMRGLP